MKKAVRVFTALFLMVSMVFGQAVWSGGGGWFYGGMSAYARTGGDEYEVIASGTCGDGVEWSLVSTGTLVVSGSDVMTDWDDEGEAAWSEYNDDIKSVVIGSGVKNIGGFAFFSCPELASVTISDSVTSIGECAFYGCPALKSVDIPDSVTSIGGSAFSDCTGLESVTIGNGLTSIGNIFSGCTSLKTVTIGSGVTSIGNHAFYGCTGLITVTIPEGCTSIGDYAFCGCSGLTTVTIPDTVMSIGYEAFYNCGKLADVYFGGSERQWKDVKIAAVNDSLTAAKKHFALLYVGSCGESLQWKLLSDGTLTITGTGKMKDWPYDSTAPWSQYRSSIKTVRISNGVTSIGYCAFNFCTGLTSVTIGDSVTSIGSDAFYCCTGLTSVTIPDSVTSIGEWAFFGCTKLNDVYYEGTEIQWKSIKIDSYNEPLKNATKHYLYEHLAGDINGDKSVDGRDLTRLMKYLSGENVLVLPLSPDVNGDKLVDARDLVRLMKILADEEEEIA